MPQSKSAKKSQRKNEARRARNRTVRSATRTQVKKLDQLIAAGDADAAQEALKKTAKVLDKTAAKGVMHKNTVARTKSRLARKVNALASQAPAEADE